MAVRHHPYVLSIYRFVGDQAFVQSRTELTCAPPDAYRAVEAVRAGLPSDYGATLCDKHGYNIRPSDTAAEG